MTNLYQYSERDPPSFTPIHVVNRGDGKIVGWVGRIENRDTQAYLSRRDPQEHKFHKLDGYAVSNDIITALRGRGVERVLIAELTGDVYEYAREQFDRGIEINYEEDDPQSCVPVKKALNIWTGLTSQILP